jgi:spore coat protein U-like protein
MSKHAFSFIGASLLLALVAAVTLPAQASTNKTASFLVSLTVSSDCAISASPLAFGSVGSTLATTAVTQSTNLSVTCSNGTNYTLSLDQGTTTGSSVGTRLMGGTGSNTQTVQFQLYSDVPMSHIFGDGTGSSSTVGGVGTGSAVNVPIYGQVPAQTIPTADSYSTTETATITF